MKKLVAPVVITAVMVLYFFFWLAGCVFLFQFSFWVKLLTSFIPLSLMGVSIYMLHERIQEVRSGEEDDLSNY